MNIHSFTILNTTNTKENMTQLRPKSTGLGAWFASRDDAGVPERADGISVQSSITDSYCPRPRPPPPPPRPTSLFRTSGRPEDMVIAVTLKNEPIDEPTDSTTGSSEDLQRSTLTERPPSHVSELESMDVSDAEFVATEDFINQVELEAEMGISGYENDACGEVVFRGWEAQVEEPKKTWLWGAVKKEEPKPQPQLGFVPPQSIEDAIKELQMLEGIRVKCLDEASLQTLKIEQDGNLPPTGAAQAIQVCDTNVNDQQLDENHVEYLGETELRAETPDTVEMELKMIEVDSSKIAEEQLPPIIHNSSERLPPTIYNSPERLPLTIFNSPEHQKRTIFHKDTVERQEIRRVNTDPSTATNASNEPRSDHRTVSFSSNGDESKFDTLESSMSDKPQHVRSSSLPSPSRHVFRGEVPYKKTIVHAANCRSSASAISQVINLIPGKLGETDSPTSSKSSFLRWGFMKNLTKEKVSPMSEARRSKSTSFGGLLRPPPNRDFTRTLKEGSLLDNKEERDIRFKWNQQLLSSTFAPYRKMFAEADSLTPLEDEYHAVKEAREANEENFSEIRDRMLQNGEITEREIAAFFDAFALCSVKAKSLQSQILGIMAVHRAEDEERTLRNSIARSAAMNALIRDPNTSADIKLILRHLDTAQKKQRTLEAQLKELGIVLEDIKTEEEEQFYQAWEHKHDEENMDALKRLRRHMPVNVKSATEAQLCGETTPSGKVLPKRFAKKFKTTNVLQLIRMGPGDLVKIHPASLENLCIAGLTLTESRALHAHLRPIGERWKEERPDELSERRYMWFTMMKQNFNDALADYEQHLKIYGPPGNHPYATRTCPDSGCPLIGKQCPLKLEKTLEYNFDYGFPDGPEYDEPGSLKTSNEFMRAKAQEAALALIAEKALDRRESFEAHYARFENSGTSILLANSSCEAMDYAMDRMDFLQVRWIKMRLLMERQGTASEEQARIEIMGFTEALQNVSLAVAQASKRSGMTLTEARKTNNKKPDFRCDVESGLAEELCETASNFLNGIEERLATSKVKDDVLKANINHLRILLDDLHQRNVDNLMKLGVRRPPRSRKLRTREEIETRINTKLNSASPKQEVLAGIAPPPLMETRPSITRGSIFIGRSPPKRERRYEGIMSKATLSPTRWTATELLQLNTSSENMPSSVSPNSPNAKLVNTSNISESTTLRLEPQTNGYLRTNLSQSATSRFEQAPISTQLLKSGTAGTTANFLSRPSTLAPATNPVDLTRTVEPVVATTLRLGMEASTLPINLIPTQSTTVSSLDSTTGPPIRPLTSSLLTTTRSPNPSQTVASQVTSTTSAIRTAVPISGLSGARSRFVSSPVPITSEVKKRDSIEDIKARIAARRNTRAPKIAES